MDVMAINSTTVLVKVPKVSGSLLEISDVARKIGQYGNILSYRVDHKGNNSEILFTLDKKADFNVDMGLEPNQTLIDPNDNSTYDVEEEVQTSEGPVIKLKNNMDPTDEKFLTEEEATSTMETVEGLTI